MQIKKVVTDERGETHIENQSLDFRYPDHGLEGFPLRSALFNCTHVVLVEFPSGYEGMLERSTRDQLCFCLEGTIRLKTSDDNFDEFGPGGVVLLTDQDGKGHMVSTPHSTKARIAIVYLAS